MVMDKQNYINKPKKLLEIPLYRPIPLDPKNKDKAKLINILKRIKRESGMGGTICKRMYPTGACDLVSYRYKRKQPYTGHGL